MPDLTVGDRVQINDHAGNTYGATPAWEALRRQKGVIKRVTNRGPNLSILVRLDTGAEIELRPESVDQIQGW